MGHCCNKWPHWSKLQQLILNGNSLSGELPDALGSLTNLVILNLASNKFSGILHYTFVRVDECPKHDTFSQLLPMVLCQIHWWKLKHLSVLDLSSNFFNGSLPSVLPS
ncbi:hypothetical protein O6H91_08G057400 [Diphasiastrum complanatum]|uniref:Uncharacterized protein n=1 Tax=Diphasiastrum complanatum TaxID=34168 RepID=A0ACC2CXX3_DIPCM|nr:hypothetical protein O6H91_08G057400 [Diphasiastrum complanatum]